MHQNGKLVFQIELEILSFHPFDMLTPSLKIEEVMEFQRGISVKRKLDIPLVWNCVGIALFRPFKQIPPNIQNFCNFTHLQNKL
jgi:hypothetical protein